MLRKGQVEDFGFSTVQLVLAVLGILLVAFIVVAVYNGFFGKNTQNLKDLALRTEYTIQGGSALAQLTENTPPGKNYARTIFPGFGSGDLAVVVFEKGGKMTISHYFFTDIEVELVNPYQESPAICAVPLINTRSGVHSNYELMPDPNIKKRDCEELSVKDLTIVTKRTDEQQATGRVIKTGEQAENTLYPSISGDGKYYHAFIDDLDMLYIEYTPTPKPTLLIAPINEDIDGLKQEELMSRADVLATS